MRPIEIFYHVFIPADLRAGLWSWWIDNQLSMIRQSGLSEIGSVKICLTMPADWTETFGQPIMSTGFPVNIPYPMTFSEKIKEYISLRYPFAEVVDVRNVTEPNIFEGQTLSFMHKRCQEVDIDVLYIHSKGVANANVNTSNWREVLNYFMIKQWPRCVKNLENNDVVALKDARTFDKIVSGNFWWSKSSYIKTLPEPIQSNLYLPNEPHLHPGEPTYRYAFEYWIMANSPKVEYLFDTNTDHYGSYFFVENLPKEHR